MRNKRCVCTPVLLVIATLSFASASQNLNDIRGIVGKHSQRLKLEKVVGMRDKSLNSAHGNVFLQKNSSFAPNFATEISKCIEERQFQITENVSQGKAIILNCFKTMLIINILKYMGESPKSKVKLFDGVLELEKIPEGCGEVREGIERANSCVNRYGRKLGEDKRKQYVLLYEKAMMKLINERNRLNAYKNQTEKEREKLLNRINENSQAFLSEVIRSIGNEEAEKTEEEKLKKEMADPKLLAVLDEVSKSYMLRLRFYPGMTARMMRSHNGGFTFDLEMEDRSEEDEEQEEEEEEEEEKEVLGDEESTREIKDGPQAKDYDDEDDDSNKIKRKKSKGDKKKKKEKKKKAKKLKKIIPYLLIPMLIQMTLLPFVFKKLFFLAMKALFAGKVALILVGFNLLRNTCIKDDDDFQKIRVEHYGYRKGEEYGAWVNGRSLQESLIMSALNEEFFRGQKPVTS